ncbi:MAG: adenylyl-sulfate kinase [Verrucomicrobiia bacterium]
MMEPERLKIVIVGHVDHGKSTLIGRLFYDTDSLPQGKVESIRAACEAEGMDFEYAFLLDALLEEQEQNITIDTTQIPFRTEKRNYVIIDAPGHKEFLKNMITGAASADAAILLIDAHEGVQEQSRRHGYLLSLLGIKQVIVAVNKMDLVDFKEEIFQKIQKEYSEFLAKLGVSPRHFIPVSAKHGHHITKLSTEMAWYHGPVILNALDSFEQPAPSTDQPLRLMVQDIYRFDKRRIVAGRIESGTLKVGDELVFWPDRKRSRVKSIEAWGAKKSPTESKAGESVAITLTEQIFVERGQLASHLKEGPVEAREFKANLFWLHNEPLKLNTPHTLRLATQEVEARIIKIARVIDSSTLEEVKETRYEIGKNEVAEVIVRARRPLAFDNIDRFPTTARFVIQQGSRIGGGGIIHDADYNKEMESQGVTSANITWTVGKVTREDRSERLGHQGAVIWLTGLSGSGKSTLAVALENSLHRRGMASYILDGDNLRHGLCSDLGFSAEDRAENIRRAGELAKMMAEAGLIVVTSLISPFAKDRQRVREICHAGGIVFAEVYVNAPIEVCEQRDPRQLYKKARAGEIKGFTGIDSPYEAPQKPDLEIKTGQISVQESLDQLLELVVNLSRSDTPLKAEEAAPGTNI